MLLSAVPVLVVAQSSSEIPEGLMNNPVLSHFYQKGRDCEKAGTFTNICGKRFRNACLLIGHTASCIMSSYFRHMKPKYCSSKHTGNLLKMKLFYVYLFKYIKEYLKQNR